MLSLSRRKRCMQTLSTKIEDLKVRRLVEAARKEPVTVLEDGEPVAVVLSPEEFERLDEQDRIRREAKARLLLTMAAVHAEAAGNGLTEAKLDRLLADES
jgi:prevent-host-death family protein